MFEVIVVSLVFMIGIVLGISYEKQKDIYNKLWQLHEITNEIHSLLRDELAKR